MKKINWQILLGTILILFSALCYLIHYFIFRDPHHIFIYLFGDVAFVFIEVLMVTLVIHRLLGQREKRVRLEKLNMVIGVFFSETGTQLLRIVSESDPDFGALKKQLLVKGAWSDTVFADIGKSLKDHDYNIKIRNVNLPELKSFLVEKRDFLLRLLENPNLLEHESFTDLLRAVFHLTEELGAREILEELPDTDYEHLAGDIRRVYVQLVQQWLEYMKHLKVSYPYLFSLALRTNPFDEAVSVIVGKPN